MAAISSASVQPPGQICGNGFGNMSERINRHRTRGERSAWFGRMLAICPCVHFDLNFFLYAPHSIEEKGPTTENWELSAGEIEASESLRWTQSGLQIGNDKHLKLFGSNHIYFSHMHDLFILHQLEVTEEPIPPPKR